MQIIRDVSSDKNSLNRLLQNETTLRSFFNSTSLLLGVVELVENDILHIADNPRAVQFFGLKPGETENKTASQMGISREVIENWRRHYIEAERTRQAVSFDYWHKLTTEQRHLTVTVDYIGDGTSENSRFSYAIRDTTVQKKTEQSLQEARDELERRLREKTLKLELALEAERLARIESERRQMLFDSAIDEVSLMRYAMDGTIVWRDFSEFLDREKKLKESEKHYRLLCELSPHPVWTADSNGNTTYANQVWYKYTGLSKRQTLSNDWAPIVHSDDWVRAKADWEKALQKNDPFISETRIKRARDFQYRWHLIVSRPIKNPDGSVIQWVGVATDIHDSKVTMEKLEESEVQFRSFANSINQLAWMASSDGWVYWYNERWYHFTGTTFDEMKGWGWEKVHHPEHVERVVSFVKEAWKKPEPWELTYPLRCKSGEWRWFLTRAVPILDSSGKITRWFGTNTDIEDQKQALSEISRREQQLRTILEVLPVGVGIIEPSGRMTHMNQKTRDIWAGERPLNEWNDYQQYVGYWPETGEQLKSTEWALARAVLEKKLVHSDIVNIVCFDGTKKTVLLSAAPIMGTEQQEVLGGVFALQDITELKKAEKDLRSALQVRDEFLSIASHELKTPITPVKLQVQSLLRFARNSVESTISKDRVVRVGESLDKQVKRLTILVDDLLDVSKISAGKLTLFPEWTEISQLMLETIERFSPELKGVGCQIFQDIEPAVHAYFDKTRIEQVLSNLISNAIKYASGKPVKFQLRLEDQNIVRIEVQDHGPGIKQEHADRIFSRFERAGADHTKIAGLGLGLYISRQIMVAHQGSLRVESDFGEGSRFILEFPKREFLQGHS